MNDREALIVCPNPAPKASHTTLGKRRHVKNCAAHFAEELVLTNSNL